MPQFEARIGPLDETFDSQETRMDKVTPVSELTDSELSARAAERKAIVSGRTSSTSPVASPLEELVNRKRRGMTLDGDDETWLNEVFSYHAPVAGQPEQYEEIRVAAKVFARAILKAAPPCADRTAALRKVREAVMTANASIALLGLV